MSQGHLSAFRYSVPVLPSDLLRRQRLLDFLHENIHRKLNLICAAAGYGKSSLLIDFAHDTDFPVAWCRLIEADSDLAMLATSLTTTVQAIFPGVPFALSKTAAQLGAPPDELAAVWAHEIGSSIADYFILVLDDFHLIQNSSLIIRFFDVLLAELPEQAHLVIAGRVIPPLRFTVLAARQEIAGLSEEHLRFTPSEVQNLIELRNGLHMPEAEAEELISGTEGWITGILLTAHLMWQALMTSLIRARQSESPLYDYLADEVFNQQPAALQRFLMESAVLPEMEPAQCDAVLGRSDSAPLLQQAEANHLFISAVGAESFVYQYHHLFRDFLIARLREQDPNLLKVLQQQAGEWYTANHMPEVAVTFYILAGQLERAAQVAEANARSMFSAGRHATLRRWAEQLASIAYEVPTLHLLLATAEMDAGHLEEAEQTLALASAGFERRNDRDGGIDAEIQRSLLLYRRGKHAEALRLADRAIEQAHSRQRTVAAALGLRCAGLCHFALGYLEAAKESLQQAADLLQSSQNRYDLAWTLNDLALVLYARGQTIQATQAQQQALAIWRERSAPGPLALALNNIGWNMHMLGQYQPALAIYDEALDWARRAGSLQWEATILIGRADVLADLNDRAGAGELYRQALTKAERIGDQALITYLYRGMARLDRLEQNYLGALEWLRRAEEISSQPSPFAPFANLETLRGIILIEMGRGVDGHAILTTACLELEHSGTLIGLAQALLFRAYAEFRAGDVEAAAQSLARAFATAEQVGHDQMLVSEALGVRAMLEALSARADIGSRAATLLARAEAVRSIPLRLTATSANQSQTPLFQVFALGTGRILKDGEEISKSAWGSQHARELFFFLIDRLPVARDEVLKVFWPERSSARAVANLHQTVYRLRHAIGCEMLVPDESEYQLAADFHFEYDIARFEEQARQALAAASGDVQRLGQLASAAAFCTGEYLSDLPVDWTLARREALNGLQVKVLREYAAELMRVARYAEARDMLAKALALEPFQDDLHGEMLVCLARMGHRYKVVDYYRRYCEMIRNELGLDPPPEIRSLYARLIS